MRGSLVNNCLWFLPYWWLNIRLVPFSIYFLYEFQIGSIVTGYRLLERLPQCESEQTNPEVRENLRVSRLNEFEPSIKTRKCLLFPLVHCVTQSVGRALQSLSLRSRNVVQNTLSSRATFCLPKTNQLTSHTYIVAHFVANAYMAAHQFVTELDFGFVLKGSKVSPLKMPTETLQLVGFSTPVVRQKIVFHRWTESGQSKESARCSKKVHAEKKITGS